MKLTPNHDRTEYTGTCDQCNQPVIAYRREGDFTHDCGAIYNAFGQRLRDDLYSRPNRSEWDEDCGDLEGMYEADLWGWCS